jgi:hypothetical protein
MIHARVRTIALVSAALLSPLGCGVGTDGTEPGVIAEALTGPTVVANMSPAGLVESTGNLYWTENRSTIFPRSYNAQVYRAAKTNTPGQEVILYQESSSTPFNFSNITFANYGGVWYGYFIANYRVGGAYIKRVPLDGSSGAVILGSGNTLASVSSPLLCDGTYLYFYGAGGMYAETLDGSRVYDLGPVGGITSFGFDSQHVYFAAGTTVYRAYKPNVATYYSAIATTSSPVTALAVAPGATGDAATVVYWGAGGSVSQYTQSIGVQGFASPGGAGLVNPATVTSMSFDGTNVLWTWNDNTNSNNWVVYKLSASLSLGHGTLTYVGNTGARSVMGDASRIFYINNTALERLNY